MLVLALWLGGAANAWVVVQALERGLTSLRGRRVPRSLAGVAARS
jgi:hypothetical protein